MGIDFSHFAAILVINMVFLHFSLQFWFSFRRSYWAPASTQEPSSCSTLFNTCVAVSSVSFQVSRSRARAFLLSPHAFARLPLGSRFLPLRGNGKDCYAGYRTVGFCEFLRRGQYSNDERSGESVETPRKAGERACEAHASIPY